uniref:KATNIP domain-containing protein n=1 Tax=Meloidogyne enterolobii TaxID=390850 RepID=A0A6V7W1E4_MELEN|nr:unnamed protein product [Meloidogyne enterolobii]
MNQQEDDCLNNSSCNNNAVNNELGRQEWDNFGEIPELPTGQTLRFELLSPWDDPTYIGLGRIEIFNSQGERPSIINTFTNSLENYGNLFNLFGEERQQQRPSTSPLINKKVKI